MSFMLLANKNKSLLTRRSLHIVLDIYIKLYLNFGSNEELLYGNSELFLRDKVPVKLKA